MLLDGTKGVPETQLVFRSRPDGLHGIDLGPVFVGEREFRINSAFLKRIQEQRQSCFLGAGRRAVVDLKVAERERDTRTIGSCNSRE